jgi:hypothetical protein
MNINLIQDSAHAAISSQLLLPATKAGHFSALPSDLQVTYLSSLKQATVTYKVNGQTTAPKDIPAEEFKAWVDSMFPGKIEFSQQVRIESEPNNFTYATLQAVSITGGLIYNFTFSRRLADVSTLLLTPSLENQISALAKLKSGLIIITGPSGTDFSSLYLYILKQLAISKHRIISLESSPKISNTVNVSKIKLLSSATGNLLEPQVAKGLALNADVLGINVITQKELQIIKGLLEQAQAADMLVIVCSPKFSKTHFPLPTVEVFDVETYNRENNTVTVVGSSQPNSSLELSLDHFINIGKLSPQKLAENYIVGPVELSPKELTCNTLITGGIGSGKTISGLFPLIQHVLSQNSSNSELKPGGIIVCPKGDLIEIIATTLAEVKRDPLTELIILQPAATSCLEFIDSATSQTFLVPFFDISGKTSLSPLLNQFALQLQKDQNAILCDLINGVPATLAAIKTLDINYDFELPFIGWRQKDNVLYKLEKTEKFFEVLPKYFNDEPITIALPKRLKFLGLKKINANHKLNIWSLFKTSEDLIEFLLPNPPTENDSFFESLLKSTLIQLHTVWYYAHTTAPLTAKEISDLLLGNDFGNLHRLLKEAKTILHSSKQETPDFKLEQALVQLTNWTMTAQQTQHPVQALLQSALQPHLDPQLIQTFATTNTFDLSTALNEGKVVILACAPNISCIQINYLRFIHSALKTLACTKTVATRPILHIIDDCPEFLTPQKPQTHAPYTYLALSRQLKLINVIALQSLSALQNVLIPFNKTSDPTTELQEFLQHFHSFVWYGNTDILTNTVASHLCGVKPPSLGAQFFRKTTPATPNLTKTGLAKLEPLHAVIYTRGCQFFGPSLLPSLQVPKLQIRHLPFHIWFTRASIENQLHNQQLCLSNTSNVSPGKPNQNIELQELVASPKATLLLKLLPSLKTAYKQGVPLVELRAFLLSKDLDLPVEELLDRIKSS